MLVEDVSIRYRHIEQEAENEFVKFSALCAAVVVATQLIPPVYSSHVGVVLDDGLGAWDRGSGAV